MILALSHVTRVAAGIVRHAVSTRRIAVLVLAVLGSTVVVLTILGNAVAPFALYPFL